MHFIIIFLIVLVATILLIKIPVYKEYGDNLNQKFGVTSSQLKFSLFRTTMTIVSLGILSALIYLDYSDFAVPAAPILSILSWAITITIFYNKSSQYSFYNLFKASMYGLLISLKAYIIALFISFILVNILAASIELSDHGIEAFLKKHTSLLDNSQ